MKKIEDNNTLVFIVDARCVAGPGARHLYLYTPLVGSLAVASARACLGGLE